MSNDHPVRVEEALAENIRQQIIDGTTAAGAGYDRVTLTWNQARTVLASLARAPHPIEAQGGEGGDTTITDAAIQIRVIGQNIVRDPTRVSQGNRLCAIADKLRALTRPDPSLGGGLDMRKVCDALGFEPDNHHNALKCPYCNPDGLVLSPPSLGMEGVREALERARVQFVDYAHQHDAKHTVEADAKAKVDRGMAAMCAQAIASISTPGKGEG